MRRLGWISILVAAIVSAADYPPSRIDEARILPMDHPAIAYSTADPADRVARLQQRLDAGDLELGHDRRFGYLPAVLDALGVPVSSQALVFSKTSFQAVRIFPRVPRAVYHSPDVSVAWVRGGGVVELASTDPKLGIVFYTLDQRETSRPQFHLRTTECTSCHVGAATLGVPGLMVRSVYPDRGGSPLRGPTFISDHRSPLAERWGGWYVSGESGSQTHLGNLIVEGRRIPNTIDFSKTNNVTDLKPFLDTAAYLAPTSDIVSLMVLEHQTRMTNLIIRLGYEARILLHASGGWEALPQNPRRRIEDAAEELVRHLLFTDEFRLEAPLKGTSGFAAEFSRSGRRDSRGRSLRELDLKTRLLRYPCSYLIHSEAFDALPDPARNLVYRRLWEVLSGPDDSAVFRSISKSDRRAILEILRDTKDGLPDYWRSGGGSGSD